MEGVVVDGGVVRERVENAERNEGDELNEWNE